MSADTPTILATSGGYRRTGGRTALTFSPLFLHAIELAGVSSRRPRVCHVGTASGDQRYFHAFMDEAARERGIDVGHLNLFPMPNEDDLAGFVMSHDVVWVGGGSVANLLALWSLHGLGEIFEGAWRAGIVLAGVSAGSICWHVGGTTDSFGPELRAVTNGLGLLPYSNGVHYDTEPQRRPFFCDLVARGEIPDGFATDDGVGLVYRGTTLEEAVTEVHGKGAYAVRREGEDAHEDRIEPRVLPGAD